MARFGKAAAMLTAAETARQWARKNPEKANTYIDRASGFVDERTRGRYHSRIESLTRNAKKGLTGQDTVSGSARDSDAPAPPQGSSSSRPFPDLRA